MWRQSSIVHSPSGAPTLVPPPRLLYLYSRAPSCSPMPGVAPFCLGKFSPGMVVSERRGVVQRTCPDPYPLLHLEDFCIHVPACQNSSSCIAGPADSYQELPLWLHKCIFSCYTRSHCLLSLRCHLDSTALCFLLKLLTLAFSPLSSWRFWVTLCRET